MNWLHYLLEANLYLMVFYAMYCLFLNKETYYTLNRIYLLFSCVISFLLPVLQIGVLKSIEPTTQGTMVTVISGTLPATKPVVTVAVSNPLTMQDVLLYTYLLGVIVLTTVLLFKLFKVVKMTRAAHKLVNDQYKMVNIQDANTAFSFFNYLFIGSNTAGSDVIIRHELVHIRQKHSADIIFMEVMKIMNWFNPFIYLMQISLKTVHEYIADEQTAAVETDALTYSSFLVNNAYGLNGSSITHSFFNYNLLKKRIIMLNQKRSGNLARLKYLMAVPICAGMLCASTLGFSKTYGWIDLVPQHKTTAKLVDTSAKKQPVAAPHAPAQINKKALKVPPPPPPVPTVKTPKVQPPPPPAPPAKTSKVSKVIVTAPQDVKLPPPPPPKNPLDTLYHYIGRHVRYSAAGRANLIAGRVITTFNVNNGKIEDAKISRGIDDFMDAEVLRVIKNYDGPLNLKSGKYAISVSYQIADEDGNIIAKEPEHKAVANDKNKPGTNDIVVSDPVWMLNEVVVVAYPKRK